MRSEVVFDGFFPVGCQTTIDPRVQIVFFHALTCLQFLSAGFAARCDIAQRPSSFLHNVMTPGTTVYSGSDRTISQLAALRYTRGGRWNKPRAGES